MDARIQPICPEQIQCKCCGAAAFRYGVVDFHKNCEIYRRNALAISGVPIYYHRCPRCRFLFTTALDHFTHEDFQKHIYNEQYPLIDPEYQEIRPRDNAAKVCGLFVDIKPERVLDYGGGSGLMGQLIRAGGFPHVDIYDPFVSHFSEKPVGRYDCVICFEVVEHATDPEHIFRNMSELLTDDGLILFSTLIQPADIDQQGLNWWYAAPRNAHVSLYTKQSLAMLVQPLGFNLGSFNESYHVLFRGVPDFARHFIRTAIHPAQEQYASAASVA
jgi:2-polyprenyl-6-hydroxyphenyl methylase/3-demethylubiquinone-9 3-methyltransferase